MTGNLNARLNRLEARLSPTTTGATVWVYVGHPGNRQQTILPPMNRAQNVWTLFVADCPDWLAPGLMVILDNRPARDDLPYLPAEQQAALRSRLSEIMTGPQRRVMAGADCIVLLTYVPLGWKPDEDDRPVEIVVAEQAWLESGGTPYEWRQLNLPVRVEQIAGPRPPVDESPKHMEAAEELLDQALKARAAGPPTFRALLANWWPNGLTIDGQYVRFDRD